MGAETEDDLAWIASATGASALRRERVQTLWGGYGELFRVHLTGAPVASVMVKSVSPPARARASKDVSYQRKRRSYEVEMAWYRGLAQQCDDACRVPALIDSRVWDDRSLLVLEDLDAAGFSGRHDQLKPVETQRCLEWLAAFHARFLGVSSNGLWKTGTYWHLATRSDELGAIADHALRDAAPILDTKLRAAKYQTVVHGDAKAENFCFARDARAVAAVDFQYVGGGPGVKDVAYLLMCRADATSSASELRHLDKYFACLRAQLELRGAAVDIDALESEWRALYPIACADFYRFLAGWAPQHWNRDAYAQKVTRAVLRALA